MPEDHRLRGFDQAIRQAMRIWDVPGAAVGIVCPNSCGWISLMRRNRVLGIVAERTSHDRVLLAVDFRASSTIASAMGGSLATLNNLFEQGAQP